MQPRRRFTSIGLKLSILVSTIVFLSIFLIDGLFMLKDFQKTIASERERLTATASAFSAAATQGVVNGDRRAVLEAVRGIRSLPDITYVGVRTADGNSLAEIGSSLALVGRDGEVSEKGTFGFLFADSLTTRVPVVSSGRTIGTLEIRSNIAPLRARYIDGLAQMLVIGLAGIAIAGLIANMTIRRLIGPLRGLTRNLISMGEYPDLTNRFDYKENDEVGVLAEAFNKAFARIEERDQAIRRHRDTLEETVEIRTQELKEAVVEAKRANAAKSDFLATMSHEIRTPMNGMLVMAELLAAAPLADKQRRYAQVISRSGQSLLNIINDILDMSKIEAGRLELEHVPFSIDTLVEDTVSLFAARAHEKELALATEIEPDVAAIFNGDPTRLSQVIGNLVNNALKFTETGGVTIIVSVLDASDGRQTIRLAVRDTGIGIAEDKLKTIFEAFSQADQTITRNFGGTGLGLSISRNLIDAMGGEISVESALGEGACFCFELDLPIEEIAVPQSATGRTILLLDSDPLTRAAGERMLSVRGMRVLGPQEAGEATPDAIVGRPRLVADYLSFMQCEAPIVLLRSYGRDGDAEHLSRPAAGEMALPLLRREIDNLCRALTENDFSLLAASEAQDPISSVKGSFGHFSVLAVDDNAVNREVLNEALTALGVSASFAASGEQAVERYSGRHFDLVFMDCSMPGMDGYQATAELREIERREGRDPARIVALTAHVTGVEAERWRTAGMDSYVPKPFTIERLAGEFQAVTSAAHAPVGNGSNEPAEPGPSFPSDVELPLISPETLQMFESVSGINGGDMKRKIFSLFIEGAGDGLARIDEAVAERAPPREVAALVHALKSMCSSAGAKRCADVCESLETAAKNGVMPDAEAMHALHEAVDRTVVAMYDSLAPDTHRIRGVLAS